MQAQSRVVAFVECGNEAKKGAIPNIYSQNVGKHTQSQAICAVNPSSPFFFFTPNAIGVSLLFN